MTPGNKLVIGLVLLLSTPNALAYLDPGTGSMIIQATIAAIAMIGVTARLYWHRLLLLLGIHKKTPAEKSSETRSEAPDADADAERPAAD